MAETALRAYVEDGTSNPPGRVAITDGPFRRLFWRVAEQLDYLVTLARLRILDAVYGPEPETPADRQRQPDRERIESAFPRLSREEPRRGDFPVA